MIEAARNLAGIADANSTEFDPATAHPVISTMAEQLDIVAGEGDMGGTMRLGMYPAKLAEGSHRRARCTTASRTSRSATGTATRSTTPTAPSWRRRPACVFSGTSPDGKLVEYVEYPREVHPYLVATQAHPELRSRPTRPHPLFAGARRGGAEIQGGRTASGRHPGRRIRGRGGTGVAQ